MNKKLGYGILLLLLIGFAVYRYTYQSHRNISNEKASYSMSIPELEQEFITNDSLATIKFQDQTIEIKAKITAIDKENRATVLDNTLFASFTDSLPKNLIVGQTILIKGRFLGYDELLEEFKMDQCTVVP